MLKDTAIRYLPEFITLVEVGNYIEAAEELYTSQSSLSKHMQLLEQETGHQLLARTGRKLVPTQFGYLLLDYARRFVELDRSYQEAKSDFEAASSTSIHIAISQNMNSDHMVNMLWDHFITRHPGYHLNTGEFHSPRTLEQIFAMGYELAFHISDSPEHPVYNCYQWSADPIVALIPLEDILADRESIGLELLSQYSFVLPPDSSPLQEIILGLCKTAGFQPRVSLTIHGGRNLVDMVRGGMGVALAPLSDVQAICPPEVAVVGLEPAPTVYLNLYYRKDKPLSKAAKTFLNYAIDIHKNHKKDIPFLGPEGPVENIFFE